MDIPLRNRKGSIIAYAKVSNKDFEEINKYKWCKSKYYATSKIDNNHWQMHRYVMIKILNTKNLTPKNKIDHTYLFGKWKDFDIDAKTLREQSW